MGEIPTLFSITKEVIKIETNIIYNSQDFRTLILEKAKEGAYYLVYDDLYFEKLERNKMITREVLAISERYTRYFNIVKYISFKVKDNYTTREIAELVEMLRKYNKVLLTIFNQKNKECFLLFISNKDDSLLENNIKDFLEFEVR